MTGSKIIAVLVGLVMMAATAQAADLKGSSDHPLFPRFAGSEIIGYCTSDYGTLTLALGKAYQVSTGAGAGSPMKKQVK